MSSVHHTHSFELSVPVDKLFPLFSPEGEKLWVPEWDYRDVMGTPDLAEDYVFLTALPDRDQEVIWVVKKFNPENWHVEFYKVHPGDKVGLVKVICQPLGENKTEVQVGYKYTAISNEGEEFISNFTADTYVDFIGEWAVLLKKHFAILQ